MERSEVYGSGGTKNLYITRNDLDLPPDFDHHILLKVFFWGARMVLLDEQDYRRGTVVLKSKSKLGIPLQLSNSDFL